MAKESSNGSGEGAAEDRPSMALRGHFVKTMDFKGPGIHRRPVGEAKTNFKIQVNTQELEPGLFQLDLNLIAEVETDKEKILTINMDYGAQYQLNNVPKDQQEAALIIEGGRQVFPYIQRVIADMTRDGGLPPLMIPALDFVQIYKLKTQAAEEATKS